MGDPGQLRIQDQQSLEEELAALTAREHVKEVNLTNQDLSKEEIEFLLKNIHLLDHYSQTQLLEIVDELNARKTSKQGQMSLLSFVHAVDPDYIVGPHHKKLAQLLEDMAFGRKSRVTVNIAPRFGKSMLTSIYFPAWFIGNFPDKKIMMVSHTADLAVDFGRKVRNVVDSDAYQTIFPGIELAKDSKSAGRWNTNKGGEYFAVGIGGAIAGRGADLLVIDDPHNEQDVLNGNIEIFEKAYEWYAYGARTRLMPGGRVAVVMTRWALNDLTGKLVDDMVKNEKADQWEVVEFPALLPSGDSLWPEFWTKEALEQTKASMPSFQWNAQYMQQPTASESAIIKREWWREWTNINPPPCEYIIMTCDAAAEKNNRADYTGITTWGVFYLTDPDTGEEGTANIILLNSIKQRMEFPELKAVAAREYKDIEPDWFVVEKKSAGTQLYQEMRRAGIPVQEYTPHRGSGDKVARLNSVSDIFSAGMVWYPAGRRWAEEVVDEVCAFPASPNDDLVDCTVMALMRFRNGGFIRLPSDRWWDDEDFEPRRAAYY